MTENKFDSANGFMMIEISIYLAFKYLTEKIDYVQMPTINTFGRQCIQLCFLPYNSKFKFLLGH